MTNLLKEVPQNSKAVKAIKAAYSIWFITCKKMFGKNRFGYIYEKSKLFAAYDFIRNELVYVHTDALNENK